MNLEDHNYIIIRSYSGFSKKRYNACFVDLTESKVYQLIYEEDDNKKYQYYKDITLEQNNELYKYINENDLFNANIDKTVLDAGDYIEINIFGKKKLISNASCAFTDGKQHVFDDIIDIVFGKELLAKYKSFFAYDFKEY